MSVYTKSSNHSALMKQLNLLLTALRIPIHLQSPTQLTPSLLIAILETLQSERIQHNVPSDTPENINLQYTKIFLGVLETDVLRKDVGLSNLDPRHLANGGLEECTYVAELLCWIGRRSNLILGDDPFEMYDEPLSASFEAHSPSTSIITRTSLITPNFSVLHASDSNTSIDSNIPSTPTPKATPRAAPEPQPRCIHEIPSPILASPLSVANSVTTEEGFLGTPSPSRRKVRRTGYISPVDEDLELLSFERSRSMSNDGTCNTSQDSRLDTLSALRESSARTVFLYQERARLLKEVAWLESQQFQSN